MSAIVRVAKRRNRPASSVKPESQTEFEKKCNTQAREESNENKENQTFNANTTATRKSVRLRVKDQKRCEQGQESDSEDSAPSSSSEEEGVHEVECILDRRMRRGKVEYRIKWKKIDEITWEPESNLAGCPRLLRAFEDERRQKEGNSRSIRKGRRGAESRRSGRRKKENSEDEGQGYDEKDLPEAEEKAVGVAHRCGVKTEQGHRPENQDAYIIPTLDTAPFHVFGVLDGHGDKGRFASHKGVEILRDLVVRSYDELNADKSVQQGEHKGDARWMIQKALERSLAKVDEELKADGEACGQEYGTTAVLCVQKEQDLVIANVGDSKAVLFREAPQASAREKIKEVICTTDHKASCRREAIRISAEKGRVGKDLIIYPSEEETKQSGLAMTRALGHVTLSKYGVIAKPDFYSASLRDKDMLVLACDGLWDVLNTREVTRFVATCAKEGKGPQAIANALVERAERKWIQGLGKGRVADNITVIVVLFCLA